MRKENDSMASVENDRIACIEGLLGRGKSNLDIQLQALIFEEQFVLLPPSTDAVEKDNTLRARILARRRLAETDDVNTAVKGHLVKRMDDKRELEVRYARYQLLQSLRLNIKKSQDYLTVDTVLRRYEKLFEAHGIIEKLAAYKKETREFDLQRYEQLMLSATLEQDGVNELAKMKKSLKLLRKDLKSHAVELRRDGMGDKGRSYEELVYWEAEFFRWCNVAFSEASVGLLSANNFEDTSRHGDNYPSFWRLAESLRLYVIERSLKSENIAHVDARTTRSRQQTQKKAQKVKSWLGVFILASDMYQLASLKKTGDQALIWRLRSWKQQHVEGMVENLFSGRRREKLRKEVLRVFSDHDCGIGNYTPLFSALANMMEQDLLQKYVVDESASQKYKKARGLLVELKIFKQGLMPCTQLEVLEVADRLSSIIRSRDSKTGTGMSKESVSVKDDSKAVCPPRVICIDDVHSIRPEFLQQMNTVYLQRQSALFEAGNLDGMQEEINEWLISLAHLALYFSRITDQVVSILSQSDLGESDQNIILQDFIQSLKNIFVNREDLLLKDVGVFDMSSSCILENDEPILVNLLQRLIVLRHQERILLGQIGAVNIKDSKKYKVESHIAALAKNQKCIQAMRSTASYLQAIKDLTGDGDPNFEKKAVWKKLVAVLTQKLFEEVGIGGSVTRWPCTKAVRKHIEDVTKKARQEQVKVALMERALVVLKEAREKELSRGLVTLGVLADVTSVQSSSAKAEDDGDSVEQACQSALTIMNLIPKILAEHFGKTGGLFRSKGGTDLHTKFADECKKSERRRSRVSVKLEGEGSGDIALRRRQSLFAMEQDKILESNRELDEASSVTVESGQSSQQAKKQVDVTSEEQRSLDHTVVDIRGVDLQEQGEKSSVSQQTVLTSPLGGDGSSSKQEEAVLSSQSGVSVSSSKQEQMVSPSPLGGGDSSSKQDKSGLSSSGKNPSRVMFAGLQDAIKVGKDLKSVSPSQLGADGSSSKQEKTVSSSSGKDVRAAMLSGLQNEIKRGKQLKEVSSSSGKSEPRAMFGGLQEAIRQGKPLKKVSSSHSGEGGSSLKQEKTVLSSSGGGGGRGRQQPSANRNSLLASITNGRRNLHSPKPKSHEEKTGQKQDGVEGLFAEGFKRMSGSTGNAQSTKESSSHSGGSPGQKIRDRRAQVHPNSSDDESSEAWEDSSGDEAGLSH